MTPTDRPPLSEEDRAILVKITNGMIISTRAIADGPPEAWPAIRQRLIDIRDTLDAFIEGHP